MVTLDGVEYTFNGYGEYTLLKVYTIGFHLQGRMEPLPARDGRQIKATVYTAFAMKENGSDTIEIRLNGRGFLDVVVNGQLENFDDEQTVDFKNVMIIKEGNNTKYSAIFHSGVAVIAEGFTTLMQFTVMMPKHFKRYTSGLLGYWDDNKNQEFLLPNGSFLNTSSNSKSLHYDFGLKWATQAHESLFTYGQGKSHQTYSNPNFLPVFVDMNNMVFEDKVLERKARSACGNSVQCLFDVQATGDTNIGLVTKNSIQQLQEIINITETKGCIPLDANFANGFYERNDSEGSITYWYRCQPEFILNGSSIVSCFQGEWNGTAPSCLPIEAKECPSVETKIQNGEARSRGRLPTAGSEVLFECLEGYDLVGADSIVCREDGTWSSATPYCRKRCSKVTILNGNTTYNETEHHVTAHFTCIKGYKMVGADQILCIKSNGTWTDAPPSCQLASGAVEHLLDSKGYKTKAIAIGVTLSLMIILALCILVVYLFIKRKSSNPKKQAEESFRMENEETLLTKDERKKVEVVYL
ncbi:sushi domain-containing protein 2-like [Actinia tenebrosa]|nr:sushi domain-containing protein 2-like [Actinia tenebrosa]